MRRRSRQFMSGNRPRPRQRPDLSFGSALRGIVFALEQERRLVSLREDGGSAPARSHSMYGALTMLG
jgi:hypothetical protein